ncbi:SDR family oxidoreductase [Spongiibacter sp. KMU-166]|uniref:SDR family oxidoreductase n=1 Tax=Spongiibacter thalassae TaxID=2721624 RepID=A0ABX1GB90_9GAMM|nr:SDR family oxidoreductase [Spongiibacter thalassae]NKI16442.1 SDR family oxidoreductase [Spongiibacter thalassae]
MSRLAEKVAVITGAGAGIGRASALRFADEGAAVLVTDINIDAATKVAEEIVAKGGRATPLKVDVGEEEQLKGMVELAVKEYGSIDVLFNNAVINSREMSVRDRDFLSFDPEVFFTKMRFNALSGVLASKYALPYMLERGKGSILFTSSTSSVAGEVSQFTYGASKAAVNYFVQSLAVTYGKDGIRCNAILPGVIQTESMEMWANDDMKAAFMDIQNVPRLGKPEDIAEMALFLASDESAYVNGQLYQVNGGMTCGTPMVPVVRKYLV